METPTAEQIRERHTRLLDRLRTAAEHNGHDPARLRIVGITKTWPGEVARAALDAGVRLLGESRVQEAEPKVAAVPEAEWHFVGRLQANKARRAVRAFTAIHSVDSLDLLARLRELATEESSEARLLLQVNVSGETAKGGISPDEALTTETVGAIRHGGVIGLMTIAPLGAGREAAGRAFGDLRRLRDSLEQAAGIALPELSMGMSADSEAAAAEGATLVRIGTALFGPRA
jgi:PLP dependent protein